MADNDDVVEGLSALRYEELEEAKAEAQREMRRFTRSGLVDEACDAGEQDLEFEESANAES